MINKNDLLIDGHYIQILNDFVLCEDSCNMNCDYCLSEDTKLKESHTFTRNDGQLNFNIRNINGSRDYRDKVYGSMVDSVLDEYEKYFYAPILKLSGGEVFLIKNFIEIIEKYSPRYEVIQVLTNGTLISDELIDRLSDIRNISIQLSMDGHNLELNRCRIKSSMLQDRINLMLHKLIQKGINVEIYCVLTSVNCSGIESFIKYLNDNYGNAVHLIPFPVRYSAYKKFGLSSKDISVLQEILLRYKDYETILPPLPYLETMLEFLINGKRVDQCFVPNIMFQSFDDGVITPCPNCWTIDVGNIVNDRERLFDIYQKDRIYSIMTSNPSNFHMCRKCWTDYHLFNLYIKNRITLDEIKKRKLLSGYQTQKTLVRLKQIVNCEKTEVMRI